MALNESTCHLRLSVTEPVHVDSARRAIVREASRLSRDENLIGRLTVVVQEMARNLINHAGQGELLYSHDGRSMNVVAVDSGPGMANVAQCLADHYSTTGTMGAGLGAIRRMSDGFDLFSAPGQGTVIHARFQLAAPEPGELQAGAVCTPYPGEEYCGDAWAIRGRRILVCDGLGHGHGAHVASQKARQVFLGQAPDLPLAVSMERIHRALIGTRGGAAAIAEIQPERGQVEFCGVGNIAAMLVADKARGLVSSNGTVGYKVGRIQSFSYPWDPSALLIMSSDGISSKCSLTPYPLGLHSRHPAVIAALLHRDFRRPNDDATLVVVKRD